ncbi:MAG: hypothetical protein PUB43_00930, partial [Oscillospiraceae bacterium]|nr:hypothetical protein [Oscillospiraceae bacterium]
RQKRSKSFWIYEHFNAEWAEIRRIKNGLGFICVTLWYSKREKTASIETFSDMVRYHVAEI